MFKKICFVILTLFCLGLIACAAPESGTESSAVAGQSSAGLSADFADAMPVVSQLALGTVALENGELAVSEEQAATLLPLWQAYTGLVASGGTAQAEIDGLITQIERGMTEAQIAEIVSLQLTEAKLAEMIEAGEIELGRGGGRGGRGENGGGDNGGDGDRPQRGGGGQGGQGGQGGLGGDGGRGGQGGGGLGNLSPEEIAARQAERIEAAGGEEAFRAAQVSGAVVRLLNIKVNGEPVRQGNNNAFSVANETVAAALDITVEELTAAIGEDNTVQGIIEEMGGDLTAIMASLTEVLAETGVGQNGNVDGFVENYLAGNGVGRGRGGGNDGGNGGG